MGNRARFKPTMQEDQASLANNAACIGLCGTTRERLIYLEGLIAGARAQASASQARLERPE